MELTMTSDFERREAAERLRDCRGGWSSGSCYYTIINAIGAPDTSREDGGHALYGILADLIDPDCESDRYEGVHTARAVDREALLALADEMDAYTGCPDDERCGKQMPPLMVHEYASRIREACGEVVA